MDNLSGSGLGLELVFLFELCDLTNRHQEGIFSLRKIHTYIYICVYFIYMYIYTHKCTHTCMFMHIYEIHTDREFLYFVFLNVSAEGNRFSHITPR